MTTQTFDLITAGAAATKIMQRELDPDAFRMGEFSYLVQA